MKLGAWMQIKILIFLLLSGAMAANITCDLINIDLYASSEKTHNCGCHICYDTTTMARINPGINDEITSGIHWLKYKMVKHDPQLNASKILSTPVCPNSLSKGQLNADDVLSITTYFRTHSNQTNFCKSI